MIYIIRYAEIGLKGKNRPDFENQLVTNIKKALGKSATKVKRQHGQILLTATKPQSFKVTKKLKKIFGIAWFALAIECVTSLNSVIKSATKLAAKSIKPNQTFAVRATRSDKKLSFTSKQLEIQVGDQIRKITKAKVNLNSPDTTIYIDAGQDTTYIYTQKIPGPGGLPVGSSGKVLSLLSGGFDSIASSYLLAKRGALVDFLHFHVFPTTKGVLNSKIKPLVNTLAQFSFSSSLFLASYSPFQLKTLDLDPKLQKHDLVTFRRLMVRVAEQLAAKHNYQALVLGDSLGQVASQTLQNITAVDAAVDIPIFRPLIGHDKTEIIKLVKDIGLEKIATTPYKDCCSIISTNPATRANLAKINQLETQINIKKITQEIINQSELFNTPI